MNRLTLQEFMSEQGFDLVQPFLRRNENDYPFITFIKLNNNKEINEGKNIGTNVYFASSVAAEIEDITTGTALEDKYLLSLFFAETSEEYNSRWKIYNRQAAGARSIADMLASMEGL